MTALPRIRLVLLGDSLAYGTGAARRDQTLGPRLTAALAAAGYAVELHVFAVPGATSASLGAQVRRATALPADLAVVVSGANDLARLVPPADAARDLGTATAALRAAGADVVVATAPDMSVAPVVPRGARPLVRAGCAALERLQAEVVQAAGGTVARLGAELATAFGTDTSLFATDRYHPSGAGYAVIAARLAPIVRTVADRRAAIASTA
ncbi:MAG TPA: GDSL-type esterase/lipase family protein [Mycobacteriales bacterium]